MRGGRSPIVVLDVMFFVSLVVVECGRRDFVMSVLVFVLVVVVGQATSASPIACESEGETRLEVGGQSGNH